MTGARGDMRRRGGREGFLLVEALSALAISALLIAALLSFTGLLRRSADRTAYRVETLEATNRTVWTIASEIRQATRLRWAPDEGAIAAARPTPPAQPRQNQRGATARPAADEDGPTRTGGAQPPERQSETQKLPERDFVFSGGPDRVIFALAPEQANGLRAPVMVVYQIAADGAVLRSEGAIGPQDKDPGAVRLGPVLRVEPGPERLRLAYVEKEPSGNEIVIEAWTERRRMPAAIRIDRTDPATGVLLGSLRVPILLSGEPGCANPDHGFCSRAKAGGSTGSAQGGAAQGGAAPADGDPP